LNSGLKICESGQWPREEVGLNGRYPYRDKEDGCVWIREDNFEYTMRSTYKKIKNEIKEEDEVVFDIFWKIKTLPTTNVRLESVT